MLPKFTESRLWISIILVFFYLFLADLFVDYIISREVDSVLQMVLSIAFLAFTYYTMKGIFKLWNKKEKVKQSKNKEND